MAQIPVSTKLLHVIRRRTSAIRASVYCNTSRVAVSSFICDKHRTECTRPSSLKKWTKVTSNPVFLRVLNTHEEFQPATMSNFWNGKYVIHWDANNPGRLSGIVSNRRFATYSAPEKPKEKPAEISSDGVQPEKDAKVENREVKAQADPDSRVGKLKQAVKDYGKTVMVFHVTMSLGSVAFFYMLVSSGLDVVSFLENLGVGKAILESKVTAGASTFLIAYAVHKVFAPVRIAITLSVVPFLVRYLRRIKVLK